MHPFTVHIQGAIEQAEAGPAAADQVCMARDVAIMFDELRAIADRLPSCTPTVRSSRHPLQEVTACAGSRP